MCALRKGAKGAHFAKSSAIICQRCQKPAPRTGAFQKYCAGCSNELHVERQARYSKGRAPRDRVVAYAKSVSAASREFGREASATLANSLVSIDMTRSLGFEWKIKVKVPYVQAASKNFIFGLHGTDGHLFKRKASRAFQEALALKIKCALKNVTPVQNKVWIEIFVQKPNNKSDAVNVVDLVCDAVKIGIDIDDRWFAISRLDWEIVKEDPCIFVSVFQESADPVQACSFCGQLQPFAQYFKKKGNPNGLDRVCRSCTQGGRRLVKSRKIEAADAAGDAVRPRAGRAA